MIALLRRIDAALDRIWPPNPQSRTRLDLVSLALLGGLALGWLTQSFPMPGNDWHIMYHANRQTDLYYPPWTSWVLSPLANLPWQLGLALANGITLAAVGLSTYHQGELHKNPWRLAALALAVLSFQTFVVLWTGQIDGLALLAIWGLPWLAPVALMKATFVGFVFVTRKSWFAAALVCAAASLLLWPSWPQQLIGTLDVRNAHPAAAGWAQTGWLPPAAGLLLLLNSKRTDWLQTLAAGSLTYPFLLPYHFLPLLPALGGLRGLWLPGAWLAAWLMCIPVQSGHYHWLYFVFPALIWVLRNKQNGGKQTWWELIKPAWKPKAS